MPGASLQTFIYLPPGVPPRSVVKAFLCLAFEEFKWFRPAWYGFANLDREVNPDQIDYDKLLGFYENLQTLTVTAKKDDNFFLLYPARADSPPYIGALLWVTPARLAKKVSWREMHCKQVVELMRLLRSPLAQAGLKEDFKHKTELWVLQDIGQRLEHTVEGYDEGLAGLYWRNFYGAPFVRLFGERLANLPSGCSTRLAEELVLVEPYALPGEAGSEAARERERQLIALLGPECFYDHGRHQKPTRRPELPGPA